MEQEYKTPYSIKELIVSLVLLLPFCYLSKSFIVFVFIALCLRATIWDYKHKVIPLYLLLFIFIISIFVTNKDFTLALKDGLLFVGAGFILSKFSEQSKVFFNKENDDEVSFLGEGDLPILGSIGILFPYETALSCILLTIFIAFIYGIVKKEKEIPLLPLMIPSIYLHLVLNEYSDKTLFNFFY